MKPRYKELLAFMKERHSIYLRRKEGKPGPWTKDPILQRYRFCNVYRELDTVTQWIDEHIRVPYAKHPSLWFMLCIARQINWPPTLKEILDSPKWAAWPISGWLPNSMRSVMRERQRKEEQVYTGAYMLNCNWHPNYKGRRDKPAFTCNLVLKSVWEARTVIEPQLHSTLQQAHAALLPYHGWGGFMAYEVVSDLRFTKYLNKASDILSWAYAGPGAKRGISRLYNAEVSKNLDDEYALHEMQNAWDWISERWPYAPKLEMREIEHSLCEFDKYERARLGQGRPRALFKGGVSAEI